MNSRAVLLSRRIVRIIEKNPHDVVDPVHINEVLLQK